VALDSGVWPKLLLTEWQDTHDTLHMCTTAATSPIILPWEAVRPSSSPDDMVLDFYALDRPAAEWPR